MSTTTITLDVPKYFSSTREKPIFLWEAYKIYVNKAIDHIMAGVGQKESRDIESKLKVIFDKWDVMDNQWKEINALLLREDIVTWSSYCKIKVFKEKLKEINALLDQYAHPTWADRLYQHIETLLLKVYNALLAGPIITESAYLGTAPKKYNFTLCQAALFNTLNKVEKESAMAVGDKEVPLLSPIL